MCRLCGGIQHPPTARCSSGGGAAAHRDNPVTNMYTHTAAPYRNETATTSRGVCVQCHSDYYNYDYCSAVASRSRCSRSRSRSCDGGTGTAGTHSRRVRGHWQFGAGDASAVQLRVLDAQQAEAVLQNVHRGAAVTITHQATVRAAEHAVARDAVVQRPTRGARACRPLLADLFTHEHANTHTHTRTQRQTQAGGVHR